MKYTLKKLLGCFFVVASVWLVSAWAEVSPDNAKGHTLSMHHARHGMNKSNKIIPACASCHYFSKSQKTTSPMQAGRERIEALFGTGKEESRNFNSSTTTAQQPPCMACHELDIRRSTYRK